MNYIDKKKIADTISKHFSNIDPSEIESYLEIPPSEIDFNYALPCYRLAKTEKKPPNIIANELKENLNDIDYLENIQVSGPYLNFKVKPRFILESIFESREDYGRIEQIHKKKQKDKKRIVIEYPSPNTNKPLHFGHIRNMLLGKSLSNLLIYLGNTVFQVNLNNDRGIHICKSMLAYKKWGEDKQPNKKSDHFVGDFYVKYNEMAAKNHEKLSISFDKEYFESNLYLKGKEIVLEGLNNGIFERLQDGAIIARFKADYNLDDKILIRSDGTSIYITQDIYLAFQKKKDFNFDTSIYIVGDEQIQHFKWLFAILDLLGFKANNYHLSYGMINLPSGKMKSREGTVVDADDIIEEIEQLAYLEVDKRYEHLAKSEKIKRAEIIGLAALSFYILKYNPTKGFVFKPDESISFEGETGPYIQYCYARIESIIQKSELPISLDIHWELFQHEKEKSLIKQMIYFPGIIKTAEKTYNIHLIPQYLLTLCQTFNSFYTSCQVISEDKELEKARLLLIKCVQIIIKIGLTILGIETLDKM